MERNRRAKPKCGDKAPLVRNKNPLIPSGTKFLWCARDDHYQHYQVCRTKCDGRRKCRNYIVFMDSIRKEAEIL
jgi:hypothetical protein